MLDSTQMVAFTALSLWILSFSFSMLDSRQLTGRIKYPYPFIPLYMYGLSDLNAKYSPIAPW